MKKFLLWFVIGIALGCGDDPASSSKDASLSIPDGGPDVEVIFGCPTFPDSVASSGDPSSDDYENFVRPFFEAYCIRCHSTSLTTREERNFAPEGLDWDDESSVRDNLAQIRSAVGVTNFMPPSEPIPSCEERFRVVRWVDVGAP